MEKPFEYELSLIKNPKIKEIAVEGVTLLPDYFYKIPASSTGKYHPAYALGEGGLYRHVRAAVGIAVDLFRIKNFTEVEQDLIITSLILHDGWKQGLDNITGYTVHDHPIIASNFLWQNITVEDAEKKEFLSYICSNIASHMGLWTTSNRSKVVLPSPTSEMQKFVFECDYIASRKDIEYNFSAIETGV